MPRERDSYSVHVIVKQKKQSLREKGPNTDFFSDEMETLLKLFISKLCDKKRYHSWLP